MKSFRKCIISRDSQTVIIFSRSLTFSSQILSKHWISTFDSSAASSKTFACLISSSNTEHLTTYCFFYAAGSEKGPRKRINIFKGHIPHVHSGRKYELFK